MLDRRVLRDKVNDDQWEDWVVGIIGGVIVSILLAPIVVVVIALVEHYR